MTNTPAQQRAALRLLHQRACPLPVGAFALELKVRLDQADQLLQDMSDAGLVRSATPEECKHCDLQEGYVLVGRLSAKIAGDD